MDQHKDILRIQTESGSEAIHYSVFYEGIPDEYRHVLEQTVGETPATKENGLRKLKEFTKKENLSTTDDVMTMVLRGCKYNIKKSELKLKKFLKLRKNATEKLCQLDEQTIDLILEDMPCSVLPYRDKHGRTVLTTKPSLRLDKYSMTDLDPVSSSHLLYQLNFPMTAICGVSYIGEGKCDSILIYYPILKSFRSFITAIIDLPLRMGRTDVVNENVLIRLFYNALRRILPVKLTSRTHFHGSSYKSLRSVYHPDMLPKDFEGNMELSNDKFYRQRLKNYIQTLREEGQKNSNIKKELFN